MFNGHLLALVIIVGILAVLGKCLEMKYYHDTFRLLREEFKDAILGNTNYISFNDE